MLLLDSGVELDDDDYSKVQEIAGTVAASAVGGTPTSTLEVVFDLLIESLPIISPVVGMIIVSKFNWTKKLLQRFFYGGEFQWEFLLGILFLAINILMVDTFQALSNMFLN